MLNFWALLIIQLNSHWAAVYYYIRLIFVFALMFGLILFNRK